MLFDNIGFSNNNGMSTAEIQHPLYNLVDKLVTLHGEQKNIDIVWKKDWQPEKEGNQSQLCVWVDGKLTAKTEKFNRKLTINIQ